MTLYFQMFMMFHAMVGNSGVWLFMHERSRFITNIMFRFHFQFGFIKQLKSV